MGTWRDLRDELTTRKGEHPMTVAELVDPYLEYCEARNRRPDFKKQAVKPIIRIVGNVPVREFRRAHANKFVECRRKEVAPATVNRGLAVLKHMFTFAVETEVIESHPLLRFRLLPEPEKASRVLTLEEERHLVATVAEFDEVLGAYVALLGETGLRNSEGLRLIWSEIYV